INYLLYSSHPEIWAAGGGSVIALSAGAFHNETCDRPQMERRMPAVRYAVRTALMLGFVLGAGTGRASADLCDLTTLNSSCGQMGGEWSGTHSPSTHPFAMGAIVRQIGPQPTGTGYIDSFVRI